MDLKVAIIERNSITQVQRETAELELIYKFNTNNLGLNKDINWLMRYKDNFPHL